MTQQTPETSFAAFRADVVAKACRAFIEAREAYVRGVMEDMYQRRANPFAPPVNADPDSIEFEGATLSDLAGIRNLLTLSEAAKNGDGTVYVSSRDIAFISNYLPGKKMNEDNEITEHATHKPRHP